MMMQVAAGFTQGNAIISVFERVRLGHLKCNFIATIVIAILVQHTDCSVSMIINFMSIN